MFCPLFKKNHVRWFLSIYKLKLISLINISILKFWPLITPWRINKHIHKLFTFPGWFDIKNTNKVSKESVTIRKNRICCYFEYVDYHYFKSSIYIFKEGNIMSIIIPLMWLYRNRSTNKGTYIVFFYTGSKFTI